MRPPTESQIQKQCVAWFRKRYPSVEQLFFAVPNGGNRNKWTAKIMKDEGIRSGVADLILLIPCKGYASLCIEMKTPKGKQQETQKSFERLATHYKNKYVVCHSLEEFQKEIIKYIE